MSRPESSFWSSIDRALSPHLRLVRIENGKVDPGTPDLYWRRGPHSGWIELKALTAWPKRASTKIHIDHFTGEQVSWLEAEVAAGGSAHVLVKIERTVLLLSTPAARDLWERRLNRQELTEAAKVTAEGRFPTDAVVRYLLNRPAL